MNDGAMVFIISDEVIPETHRGAHAQSAPYAPMVGIVVMLWLDSALP